MSKVGFIHLLVAFIIHTAALGLRWYISGHAPWSNGYESLVFMAWSAMLAGLLFYKREPFALWSTSVLTAMVLMVAHLSWMNPQISNLVPVLKSVWLTIHVSVITSSYGFLGLSAIIALSAIILQIAAGTTFKENIENAIKRLTAISEIIMIPGLYLLTIGTFLGAIWANVSWGRYWGWDPKETWALITILIYAFVIHLKYIPGLKGRYFFNVMTVIAFFSILMTYFGVNYYLSGLHSYAGGDPVPIPVWLYFAVGSLFLIFIAGNFMYKSSRPKE
jgi:cytochrome c-type biogenesis protein CcsB